MKKTILLTVLTSFFLISCDNDDDNGNTYTLSGNASASQEVPANSSAGTATLTGTYNADNNTLQYTITYTGLTGALVNSHFHGPALPGVNAGVMNGITVTTSPLTGTITLADTSEAHLLGGKAYYNLHTAAYPGGEIRGQVTATRN